MSLPLWPTAFVFVLAAFYYYFVLAGGRTFEVNDGDELSSGLAQFSFLGTGTFGTMLLGYRAAIPVANAVASAVLLLGSLALYEWARGTIKQRRFHLAWTGDVPDELCEDGPYAYVRHPLYLSYIIAFAAMVAAIPKLATLGIFLFNAALFTHAAFSDERSIASSDLSAAYARYKARAGMFLPRLRRKMPT